MEGKEIMASTSFAHLGAPSVRSQVAFEFVTPEQLNAPLETLQGVLPSDFLLAEQGFTAKSATSVIIPLGGQRLTGLIGFSPESLDPEIVRNLGATLAKRSVGFEIVSVDLDPLVSLLGNQVVRTFVEGVILGSYVFNKYKTTDSNDLGVSKLALVEIYAGEVAQGMLDQEIKLGMSLARATAFARDLVNEPAMYLTPVKFAEIAVDNLSALEFTDVEVWDLPKIRQERLGGVLGVAAGSVQEPRVVKATYTPPGGYDTTVALVGKGITFDSGGLNIKSFDGMKTMKTDMGGAAAVLATFLTLPDIAPRTRVVGFMMLTENMPSGTATKPGDVLITRNGKTIEVLNTDAEGRLVLSDGLQLASELKPDYIIDLATLTGACVVALGEEIAGLFSNDEPLTKMLEDSAEKAAEPLWRLPLPKRYKKHIDSEIADMKNIGVAGSAGAISAAMLLLEFVGDTKWAHIDIAGPSRAGTTNGFITQGGTGFGTRLLCYFLENV